jgi:hypothetical protein
MLDEKTKQAIQFLENFYGSINDTEKTDKSLKILRILKDKNRYTAGSLVPVLRELIYDILDAQIIFRKRCVEEINERRRKESRLCPPSSDKEEPDEKVVEETYKDIRKKYAVKHTRKVKLCPKFISEVLEIEDDISTQVFMEELDKNFACQDTQERDSSSEVSSKTYDMFEPIFSGFNNIKHAETLLKDGKGKEAIFEIDMALKRIICPHNIFDMRLKLSHRLSELKEYGESMRQIYLGLLKFKPALLHGKPVKGNSVAYLHLETADGERIGCQWLFNQIKDAVSQMGKIPENVGTTLVREQLSDIIKFTVIKLEKFNSQKMGN